LCSKFSFFDSLSDEDSNDGGGERHFAQSVIDADTFFEALNDTDAPANTPPKFSSKSI
jgi:hypothetical protein